MRNFILLIIISLSAFAHDDGFERVQFENDSFRDFSWEELQNKIGDSQTLLPNFACDKDREFDPFEAPQRLNLKADSLKIKEDSTKKILTYLPDRTPRTNDRFALHAIKAIEQIQKTMTGRRLISYLQTSHFPITIELGGNMFAPTVEGGQRFRGIYMAQAVRFFEALRMPDDPIPFHDIGVGGSILWHPTMKMETVESDGVKRVINPTVTLAHEMYHAFDSLRGLLDMRMVFGENFESTLASEYRASYFENLMRRELGYKLRKYYGNQTSGPGILNEQGEPILMSAPCLSF